MSLQYCNQCGRKRHANRRTKVLRRCKCGGGWGTHQQGPTLCGMWFRLSHDMMLNSADPNAPVVAAVDNLSRSMAHFMQKTGYTHRDGSKLMLIAKGPSEFPVYGIAKTLGIKDSLEWRPRHNRREWYDYDAYALEVMQLWRRTIESR